MHYCLNTSAKRHMVERNAIDPDGEVGCLYDATCDKLLKENRLKSSGEVRKIEAISVEKVRGDSTKNRFDFLRSLKFDEEILRSLSSRSIRARGIAEFIEGKRAIDSNSVLVKIVFESSSRIVNSSRSEVSTEFSPLSTHLIGKIVLGFEILVSIRDEEKLFAENLLWTEEKSRIDRFEIEEIFFSENLRDEKEKIRKLSDLTEKIRFWKTRRRFHAPIRYTLIEIGWLDPLSSFVAFRPSTKTVADRFQSFAEKFAFLLDKNGQIFDFSRKNFFFESLRDENLFLQNKKKQFDEFRSKFDNFYAIFLRKIRQNQRTSEEQFTEEIFRKKIEEINKFHQQIRRFKNKIDFAENLSNKNIVFVDAAWFRKQKPLKVNKFGIVEAIEDSLSKKNPNVMIFFSHEVLKRENRQVWRLLYDRLLASKENFRKFYVDLTTDQFKPTHLFVEEIRKHEQKHSSSST